MLIVRFEKRMFTWEKLAAAFSGDNEWKSSLEEKKLFERLPQKKMFISHTNMIRHLGLRVYETRV